MSQPTLPFRVLRPGHDPAAPAGVSNVRVADRGASITELAASIESLGLIQPLAVVAAPGKRTAKTLWYVADGNRRLAALTVLIEGGRLPADHPVPFVERDAAEAREIGLAANVLQVPMHPADRFAAFAALRDAGQTPVNIALRFGIDERAVRRVLALGSVAPAVLDAWRTGALGETRQAQEVIQVFTVAAIPEQERAFKALQGGQMYPWAVRRELGLDGNHGRWLTYVGREAYAAAGGVVVEDLFGEQDGVSDIPLLKRLADEKLAGECARLTEAGWGWAERSSELPACASYTWKQVTEDERVPTPEQAARIEEINALLDGESRDDDDEDAIAAAEAELEEIMSSLAIPRSEEDRAISGCIVDVDYKGALVLREYVIRPATVESPAAAPGKVEAAPMIEEPKGDISGIAMHTLTTALTAAVADALPANPKIGLAALLAGALCRSGYYGCSEPMKIRLEGISGPSASLKAEDSFATVLQRLLGMSVDDLLLVACQVAAFGLDLRSDKGNAAPAAHPAYQTLAGAMDADALAESIGQRWDAKAYFAGVPKAVIVAAIEEALGEDEARRARALGKGDLVARAVASVVPTGWLPREIRWPGYAGPGAEPAAAAVVALRPAA